MFSSVIEVDLFMKANKAGKEPARPAKRRRVGADGYEVITLLLWMFLFIGGLSVFFLASNNASLLNTTMTLEKNTPLLITTLVLWLMLSYVLIRFDRKAQLRAEEKYEEEIEIFERKHASWTERIESAITSKVKGSGWLKFGGGNKKRNNSELKEPKKDDPQEGKSGDESEQLNSNETADSKATGSPSENDQSETTEQDSMES